MSMPVLFELQILKPFTDSVKSVLCKSHNNIKLSFKFHDRSLIIVLSFVHLKSY